MNNPEYIIVDEIGTIVTATLAVLGWASLNYQYGIIDELNETLIQYSQTPEKAAIKFPCVYLVQPFKVLTGQSDLFYGSTSDMRIFLLMGSNKDWKSADRMANSFKPILYPLYRELLRQFTLSPAFNLPNYTLQHERTDRPYWGEKQQEVLDDVVDAIDISNISLKINNNQNCIPFKSFR